MARSYTYGTAFQQSDLTVKFFDEASVLPELEAAVGSVIGSGYSFRGPVLDSNGNFVYKNLNSTIQGFTIASWRKINGRITDYNYSGLSIGGDLSNIRTEPSGCQPCELDFFSSAYCFNGVGFGTGAYAYNSEVIASGQVPSGDSVTVNFAYVLGDIKDEDGNLISNYKGRTTSYFQNIEVDVPFSFVTTRYYRPVYCGRGCDCVGNIEPASGIDAFWEDWVTGPNFVEWNPFETLVMNPYNVEFADDRSTLEFFYAFDGSGGNLNIENCTSLNDLYCPFTTFHSVESLNNSSLKMLWVDSINGQTYPSDILDLASEAANAASLNDYSGGIFAINSCNDCSGLSDTDLQALETYTSVLKARNYMVLTGGLAAG